jgi:ABC-2 type transport system permease protein
MPNWAKIFNHINPLYYFMKVNRMVLLKGANFSDIRDSFISVSILAVSMLTLAILKYRKTS